MVPQTKSSSSLYHPLSRLDLDRRKLSDRALFPTPHVLYGLWAARLITPKSYKEVTHTHIHTIKKESKRISKREQVRA